MPLLLTFFKQYGIVITSSIALLGLMPQASGQMLTGPVVSAEDDIVLSKVFEKPRPITRSVDVRNDAPIITQNTIQPPTKNLPPATVPRQSGDNQQPVDLVADQLDHDDTTNVVTASGNVELVQAGRILKADNVSYDLNTGEAMATGNVILRDANGDVHFAEEVRLNNELKKGFVMGVQTYLAQGGKLTARDGERIGEKYIFYDTSYTPCDCEDDEDPTWAIKAEEVTVDKEDKRISYKNAKFEFFGVPLAWTPYFSHADGSVEQKSGFLSPQVEYDSRLGLVTTANYYWGIAPDKDLTVGALLTTKENPVALAEYRQRFNNADLTVGGSLTRADLIDRFRGTRIFEDSDFRGHLYADGRWDINDKWRAGINLDVTTDDQYLREYDFSGEDVLENDLYIERFEDRNYAVARVLAFQDLRIDEEDFDQPNILPEIEMSFLGRPNQAFGGRWSADLSLLGLERNNDGQDLNRAIAELGWKRRFVSDYGLVTNFELSGRGDVYYVRDRESAFDGSGRSSEGKETRAIGRAHLVTSYPMEKSYKNHQALIEPVASLTLSTNVDNETGNIPNEDSQDVQLDYSNLFETDRFPGYDQVEDSSRFTYGLRTGLYGYAGSYADVFLGQSYILDEEDNPFPRGSGLSNQESDIVGQISASYQNRLNLNYRFQLESENLSSQRHEVEGTAAINDFSFTSRYLFANALEGTDIVESREQIENAAAYYLTPEWRVRGGALHDLGEDPGLRRAIFGVDYYGCCMSVSATAQRTLTAAESGDSGTEITLRLGLKGLGEFKESGARRENGIGDVAPTDYKTERN